MGIFVRATLALALTSLSTASALAQDAVKAGSKHYTVLVDNPQVRVLRIRYAPHETSVRHSHPNSVIVYLTDAHNKFVLGNGKTIERSGKAGEAAWSPGGVHTPTNVADKPMEAILVELKEHAKK